MKIVSITLARGGSKGLPDKHLQKVCGKSLAQITVETVKKELGDDVFFVEETSLACAPPVSWSTLKERLISRLSKRGILIEETIHEEHCLFPMNLPLPDREQP